MLYAYKQEYLIATLFIGSIIAKVTGMGMLDKQVSKGADTAVLVTLFLMTHFFNSMNDKYSTHILLITAVYTMMTLHKPETKNVYSNQDVFQFLLVLVSLIMFHHVYLTRL